MERSSVQIVYKYLSFDILVDDEVIVEMQSTLNGLQHTFPLYGEQLRYSPEKTPTDTVSIGLMIGKDVVPLIQHHKLLWKYGSKQLPKLKAILLYA